MKKFCLPRNLLLLLLTLSLVSSACSLGKSLRTEVAADSEVTGTYRLILYGCNHLRDLETFALLDREGDGYTFEPFGPDFNYIVEKGVSAEEALKEAEKFITCNPGYIRPQLAKIIGPEGNTLGYEIKPLYLAFVYSVPDVLETYYFLHGDKVIARFRVRPTARESQGGNEKRDRD